MPPWWSKETTIFRSIRSIGKRSKSPTTSVCPWKGTAHYYTLAVDGAQNRDAAWYYPEPKSAAEQIRGRVAFWKGVEIRG